MGLRAISVFEFVSDFELRISDFQRGSYGRF